METLAASDTCSNRKFSKHRYGFLATGSPMCLESQEMANEVFCVGCRRPERYELDSDHAVLRRFECKGGCCVVFCWMS